MCLISPLIFSDHMYSVLACVAGGRKEFFSFISLFLISRPRQTNFIKNRGRRPRHCSFSSGWSNERCESTSRNSLVFRRYWSEWSMSIVNMHLDSSPINLSADQEMRKRQDEVILTKPYSVCLNNSSGAPHGFHDHAGSLGRRQGWQGVGFYRAAKTHG
jgi:hypothetical protein